jgi:carboxyl-terminal processing protease
MRGNGGGSLQEAVMLSALFSSSSTVVLIKDKKSTFPLRIPADNPIAFKKPVVVLIDRASASASEIVAGFLKDSGRAVVLGDVRTHGKGTVQTMLPLNQNGDEERFGSVKVTTARFYRINGDSTQVRGVESDIHLPSILDHLDIGEDKLPNALPFTQLSLTGYRRVWNLNGYVSRLRKNSKARTRADSEFLKHIAAVDLAGEVFDRKEVPLERNARKAMMKRDRSVNIEKELEDEEQSTPRLKADRKNDVVLKEAYNVLCDLVVMTGGAEIPAPKINWMDILFENL